MLEITDLSAGYGGVPALEGITMKVEAKEVVAIVGPNGAGKSTLFKTISGVVTPTAGSIRFEGRNLLAVAPAARAHLGIAHVPEGRQVFASMSVLENLQMGAYTDAGRRQWAQNLEKIYALFPVLAKRATSLAGALSGGQQQMLAIGRGLASAPKLLMLDEPSMGLAPAVADEIFERLVAIHQDYGLTILLVEQRVAEALDFAARGYVLEAGRLAMEGTREMLGDSDRIRQAYLGM